MPVRHSTYIAIDREWRTGDVLEIHVPMHLHTEALPGAPDTLAFLYGPIVLAGRLGRRGITPGADIINERTWGDVLNDPVEVPVLRGNPATIIAHVHPSDAAPLAFRTTGIGDPRDVT